MIVDASDALKWLAAQQCQGGHSVATHYCLSSCQGRSPLLFRQREGLAIPCSCSEGDCSLRALSSLALDSQDSLSHSHSSILGSSWTVGVAETVGAASCWLVCSICAGVSTAALQPGCLMPSMCGSAIDWVNGA